MKSKKGASYMWYIIVGALIAAIIGFILLRIFGGQISILGGQTQSQIGWLDDQDNDNVANRFDACICVSGEFGNDGCPYSVKPMMANDTLRFYRCSEEVCKALGYETCPK